MISGDRLKHQAGRRVRDLLETGWLDPGTVLARSRWLLLLGGVLVALLAGHVVHWYSLSPVVALERSIHDMETRLAARGPIEQRVVIVDIDQGSLNRIGHWPWPTRRIDDLIDRLFDRDGAAVVGLTLVSGIPNPRDQQSLLRTLRESTLAERDLARVAKSLEPAGQRQAEFERSLAGRAVVLAEPYAGSVQVMSAVTDLPADEDGRVRHVALATIQDGAVYPSMALAVTDRLLDLGVIEGAPPVSEGAALARLRAWSQPPAVYSTIDLPYDGPAGTYRHLPAADVLDAAEPLAALRGKIVLVGSSAASVLDLHDTPLGPGMSGAEIQANLITALLDGRLWTPSPFDYGLECLLVIALGGLLVWLLPRLSPGHAFALSLTLILLLLVCAAGAAWSGLGRPPVAGAVFLVLALLALNILNGYFLEARARREFTTVFGPYVPPTLAEQIARNPSNFRELIIPRNETLSVLFADLRGFTAVAERMRPEEVRLFLNDYFTEMSEVVQAFGGTVDKYIGDEVMAFWGAPLPDPDHARRAVLAALRMREAILRLRARVEPGADEDLDLRVGINTGLVSVGDMGSAFRRSYTVLGDAVNLAKRIESLTRYYGVGIMIGEQTRIRVADLLCREIDWVQVKGRGGVVTIFEPIGFVPDVSPERLRDLELWSEALRAYRTRQWQEADELLLELQRRDPRCELYELYRGRIARFREQAPAANWNGVTLFDKK